MASVQRVMRPYETKYIDTGINTWGIKLDRVALLYLFLDRWSVLDTLVLLRDLLYDDLPTLPCGSLLLLLVLSYVLLCRQLSWTCEILPWYS